MPRTERGLVQWRTGEGNSALTGRYQMQSIGGAEFLLDTWTGDMWMRCEPCVFQEVEIRDLPEKKNEEEVR